MPADSHFELRVNGIVHAISAEAPTVLLYVLRNHLGLSGPKYGCGLGQCGACTVVIDGKAARSCILPAAGLAGRDILTLEGLGSRSAPDPVQAAFVAENATQCGYCLNGMIMTVWALLQRQANVTDELVREELRYNLCRCGSHVEVLRAARRAASSRDGGLSA